ncbi:hypothetical protein A3J19_02320 [Candidatus Daviesbacteria bacterium RIFCSPLOWO2_02_FULL_41_8]|uniref:Membrane protein 6-pyruvoyl-tetrahydropterin synthase-related domain-containing protein n=2 Tax=Candidatus Daviesiibacteriota TaxID=1752718 RepID=A0A1F5NIH4_9BACT|nr:MAG: hypothetical protein A3D83_01110 [Candidatus Daviesbacteria bacterium RIFCSPHIGHO2_02_FULL_41_10]OGE77435.1 MAG: hypothetical protein A3J19_02320 [Candidatus Daviesbacteria bacterium RIFCSPLOWO2_02_FULL_41_8]
MTFILRYKIPILLLLLSGFIVWPLLVPGFFRVQDYLQVMRIYEMRRCIEDLQIPCRWVADMGSGYGFPLFNYYGVFPYYIAAISSYFLGFIGAAKLIFFLPLVLGGVFMYFLAKEVFGKEAAFVSAVLYAFAPYRALDIYVRGSITEVFAMALMPLVFYFFLILIKSASLVNFLAATFTLAIFLLNHNLMTMLFLPLLIVWVIYWLFIQRKTSRFGKNLAVVFLSLVLGFLLASFFILPAYFEQNLIQAENLKESEFIPNFRAHFVTVNQLFFSRFWGYGASIWGDQDGLSFQVGWPHWQLALIAGCLLLIQGFKDRFSLREKNYLLYFIFFAVSVASLLMTHNKTAFVWELIGKLQFVQFPWRFLSVAIFFVSFLGGVIVLFIKSRYRVYFIVIITFLTVFLNFRYFQPEYYKNNQSDKDLLTGSEWEFYQQGSLTDYLPKAARKPTKIAPGMPIVKGDAKVENFTKSSNKFKFRVEVKNRAIIDIPVFDFPIWKILANGKAIEHSDKGEFGSIRIELSPGSYIVNGYFENTWLRTAANSLSLIAAGVILLIILRRKHNFV